MTDLRQAAQQVVSEQAEDEGLWFAAATASEAYLQQALRRLHAYHFAAQPVQEPVTCRFCHSKKGCWAWQCDSCGEIDDVQQPAPPPKQEPVAWGVFEGNLHDTFFTQEEAQEMARLKGTHAEVRPLYTTPPAAQPEQEPVKLHEAVISAWSLREVYFDEDGEPSMHRSPSQRQWVGLTEDEIKGTWAQLWYDLTHGKLSTPDNEVRINVVVFGQALGAKLKEKNNG